MSDDNDKWKTVVEDTLTSVINVPRCEIPLVTFDVLAQGRYIRFTSKSHYGSGAGLNYIAWETIA